MASVRAAIRPLLLVGLLVQAGVGEEIPLNLYLGAEVASLDPCYASDAFSNQATSQVAESLFQYHYLERPYTLEPCLAAALGTWSADRLTYTVRLRPDVRYADDPCFEGGVGRELRAGDFLFAWKRLADPETRSPGWWIFEDRILGLDDFRRRFSDPRERVPHQSPGQSIYDVPVAGLQAPDDHTIVIQLTRPLPILPYLLAMTYTAPVPPEAWHHNGRGEGLATHVVGTGAYVMTYFHGNSRIEYRASPSYREVLYPADGASAEDRERGLLEDAGRRLPQEPWVVVRVIREEYTRWLLFSRGQLDQLSPPKDNFDAIIGPDRTGLTAAFSRRGMQLETAPLLDVTYTAFNMEDPLLGQNPYLRQAISLADGAAVWDEIHELRNDRGIPAVSPLPPGLDGYRADRVHPYHLVEDSPANRERALELARELMEQAGLADQRVVLRLEALSGEVSRQFAEEFADSMREIGVHLEVSLNTWPEFEGKVRERKAQLWGIAWNADYPDPENFLQLLYGPNAAPGPNGSNWQNARYDELYGQMLVLPAGSAERHQVIDEMIEIFQEECPWSTGVHRVAFIVTQGWLRSYKYAGVGDGYYKYYRIDRERRRELLPRFQGQ